MKSKKILVAMAIATLIISFGLATASATTDIKNEKKDTGISIESKEKKVSTYKVTWNYNGGKIGTKKTKVTTVKKGSKIGKLVATPKRREYTFKGWYTKKSGGKKISTNTKVTKKVTLFAQWTKKRSSRVLTAEEKKLVGVYSDHPEHGDWWYGKVPGIEKIIPRDKSYNNMFLFKNDGTFVYTLRYLNTGISAGVMIFHGDFHVTKGKITTSNVKAIQTTGLWYGKLSGWKPANGRTYEFEYHQSGIKVNVPDTNNRWMWGYYTKR